MFFNRFGTTGIEDEAPPYAVVQACRRLGFFSPEDVRWCQQEGKARPEAVEGSRPGRFAFLRSLLGKRGAGQPPCACGRPLPRLANYPITLPSGERSQLLLGQCRRCKTIYWKEP